MAITIKKEITTEIANEIVNSLITLPSVKNALEGFTENKQKEIKENWAKMIIEKSEGVNANHNHRRRISGVDAG